MPESTSINVGLIAKALPCAPLWIAQRAGLFAERGLDVRYELLGSGDAVTAALSDGRARFGLTTPEGALGDRALGGPLRILGALANQLPFRLIGARGRDTIASLRGGRVGVSSMTEGTVHVIQGMLARHGLRYPDDYRLDVVGTHVDRWELLQKGEIDAGLQITPWDLMAIDAGFPDLGAPSRYFPEWAFIVVTSDSGWYRQHPGETESFLGALREGAAVIYADRQRAAEMVAAETGIGTRLVAAALGDLAGGMLPQDLRITPGAVASVVQGMADGGAGGDLDLARTTVVDDAFL